MKPVLFDSTVFAVASYPLLLSLGISLFLWHGPRTAASRGLSPGKVAALLTLLCLIGLSGARTLFVLQHRSVLADPWTALFNLDAVGLASHGAFLVAIPVGIVFARWFGLSSRAIADSSAIGICLMGALGRLGCFLAGCCYGRPTDLPWGVVFPETSEPASRWGFGVPVHPTQLYEALYFVAIAFLLSQWRKKKRFEGELFLMLALFYSIARLFNDALRGDSLDAISGHGPAFWIGSVVVLASAARFLWSRLSLTPRLTRA